MSVKETPNKNHSTIDYLIANFNAPQMSNLYHVAFHLPSSLGQDIIWDGVRASAVTIPGKGLKVEDYASNLTQTKKIVNGFEDPSDNGVNISFYCDTNWLDRRIIQAWMDYIIDQDTAFDGDDELREVTPSLRYYKEYTGKIEIKTLRRDGTTSMQVNLHDAFPSSINNNDFNSELVTETVKLGTTWRYRYMTTEFPEHTPTERDTHPVYGTDRGSPNGINTGSSKLNALLDVLKVSSRFNKKSLSFLTKLQKFDTGLTKINNIKNKLKLGG